VGSVVVVVTPWSETMLIAMNTTSITTAIPSTAAAGQMLVVVVSGACGLSLTVPS
jgi:hypothetical protein